MVVVFLSPRGPSQTNSPKENSEAETKDIVTSPRSNDPNIQPKYEYADAVGKCLIIENGFQRGWGKYIGSKDKVYKLYYFLDSNNQ